MSGLCVTKFDFGSPVFDEALALRNKILRLPLNLEFYPEDISAEWDSIHLGCFGDNQELIAVLVLKPIDNQLFKMRQVAVSENHQGRGIGTLLVEMSEYILKEMQVERIELNARENAVPFYKKMNYQSVGKPFVEVGIPHYKMIKKL